MAKTLLIHIGALKTGTSAFQRSLHQDRAFFHRHGIDECPLFFGPRGIGSRTDAVSGHTHFIEALRGPFFAEGRDLLFRETFEASPHQNFLISDEHLSTSSKLLHRADIDYLHRFVDKIIVLYLAREPLDHAWSFYKEFCSWPDFDAVSFEHFLKFEYGRWSLPTHTIHHYRSIDTLEFQVGFYPDDRVGDLVLHAFGLSSSERAKGGSEPVYASLPDAWMEAYVAQVERLSGEAKTQFNFALPKLIEAYSDLPVEQAALPSSDLVDRQRDYLSSLGLLKDSPPRPATRPRIKDLREPAKTLGAWRDEPAVSSAAPSAASSAAAEGWCLATLVKAGDDTLDRFVRHHRPFDYRAMLIFVDGSVDFTPADFDDERVEVIECSPEYWRAQNVDEDIDSKILHCHDRTRDFCKQHGIAWYGHLDVDEFMATVGQQDPMSQRLSMLAEDVNEILLCPFEASFIYASSGQQRLRPVLKRPSTGAVDVWRLQRAVLVRLQRLLMRFDRSSGPRVQPSPPKPAEPASAVSSPAQAQKNQPRVEPGPAAPTSPVPDPSLAVSSGPLHTLKRLVKGPVRAGLSGARRVYRRTRTLLLWPYYRALHLWRSSRRAWRPLAAQVRDLVVRLLELNGRVRMALRPRDFGHRQRLLPIKDLGDWYAKVMGPYVRLSQHGFLGHQAGKSFRRVDRDTWVDNSHSGLYRNAAGRKLPVFPKVMLIHDDCRTLAHWRDKFQSRVSNPYLSTEMGLRRKILGAVIAAEPSEALYRSLYGIPDEHAEEGLRKGYIVEVPDGVALWSE